MIEQLVLTTLAFWSVSCVLGFCFLVGEEFHGQDVFRKIFTSDS